MRTSIRIRIRIQEKSLIGIHIRIRIEVKGENRIRIEVKGENRILMKVIKIRKPSTKLWWISSLICSVTCRSAWACLTSWPGRQGPPPLLTRPFLTREYTYQHTSFATFINSFNTVGIFYSHWTYFSVCFQLRFMPPHKIPVRWGCWDWTPGLFQSLLQSTR